MNTHILKTFFCLILIASCVFCLPQNANKETKSDKNDSEGESDDKNGGTVSPSELEKPNEKINENEDENDENFEPPDEDEKDLEKEGKSDLDSFANFLDALDKIKDDGEEGKPISPEEMKKMKAKVFEILNSKEDEQSKISKEDFDQAWDKKEAEYGDKFGRAIQMFIVALEKDEEEEEKEEENSVLPSVPETTTAESEQKEEEAPKDTFALRNDEGKICILAKFNSAITINYEGKSREQTVHLSVPRDASVKGKCAESGDPPVLQLFWEKFLIEFLFEKDDDSWFTSKVELSFDTSEPLFDGAANPKKVVGKSRKSIFETPLGRSYFCPAKEVVLLYSNEDQVAIVELKSVHIQPYDVKDGKFSTSYRCDKVVIDDEPFVPDETVPLAVGLTLALITLLILVGFSVHRAYVAARADYNNIDV